MKSGSYIVIVIALGFVLIGLLFWISPALAPAQLPLILAAIGASVAVLAKQGSTDAKVDDSIAISEKNTRKLDQNTAITGQIQVVAEQTQAATTETHKAVNSRMDDLIARVEAQGEVQTRLAAVLARAEGVVTGRAQAEHDQRAEDAKP